MFDNAYYEWNQKRIKGIVDFYGYKFFYFKKILDLGCGYGDLGGVLYRLGASVTGLDARQEHLKVLSKKFTGIKTVQANLDEKWPFHGQKFDLILDLGTLCHLTNFEKHLNIVCTSTTHLVLETSVCDSDDPYKSIPVDEDKGIYDLSYSGRGCRPSAAAIERILRESGMNFKRMDNPKFNSPNYTYDWYSRNDNTSSIGKRRIWFAVRESSPMQFANPNSEFAYPPIIIDNSPGYITPVIGTGPAPNTETSTSKGIDTDRIKNMWKESYNKNAIFPQPRILSLNEKIRLRSKENAIVFSDEYKSNIYPEIRGTICPCTHSSKMWFKKISPLFPNLKLSNKSSAMQGFALHDIKADLVMCSINNLQAYGRVWIDEWLGPAITEEHVQILKKCPVIVTPSLLNAQEIWQHIPHANVIRISKSWPAIEVESALGNYFIYFEKSATMTETLLQAWDPQWGELVVVSSSIKLPTFAKFIGDSEPYIQIMKLIYGAKAIIDLSENNYYASGIINLSNNLSLPLISNNHIKLTSNLKLIQNDKKMSPNPTIEDIKVTISKFNFNKNIPNPNSIKIHNEQHIVAEMKKLVGI